MKYIKIMLILFISMTSCQKQTGEAQKNTFSIWGMFSARPFDPTWDVFEKAAELTGVTLTSAVSQNAPSESQAYNLMVASGDIPDIVAIQNAPILEDLGTQGGLIPLQDLVKEHAPNIQKFWDDNPEYKRYATAYDGKSYYIPYYYPDISTGVVFYLREDWLKKLNLEDPVTVDDYYKVLKAFRTQDPNGNGLMDEIPFFVRGTGSANYDVLFDLFQLRYRWKLTAEEGVSYEPSTEKFKYAMKELSKWYAEGLIDPEIFTRDPAIVRDVMLGNNLSGMTIDWGSSSAYAEALKDTYPDMELKVVLPPLIDGKREFYRTRRRFAGGWGISAQAKDPIAIIKYFDFWFSEEGRRLWNFGIEGKEYNMVNGKPVFTDVVLTNASPLHYLYSVGAQWVIGVQQDYEYEKQISTPNYIKGVELYTKNNTAKVTIPDAAIKYSSEELKELQRINSSLDSYFQEMIQKWLLGASDVDEDWDTYLRQLNNLGLQRALEIQEKGLKRYIKG